MLFVVVAGTKVGGATPPPLVSVDVEVPDMMVVMPPLMMVVTNSDVTVTESEGSVTIVRVSVAVHAQEVEYTAHQ